MSENKEKKRGRIGQFFADFKAFITRGNILDLAIAVIIGGAFGKIVSSLVADIIMPLISLVAGGKSVQEWKWVISEAVIENGVETSAESAVLYGNFLQSIIDFIIIAFFIFIALRITINLKTKLAKTESGEFQYDKATKKSMVRQLKSEGKSKDEITAIIEQKEKDETLRLKAEKEARIAVEEANKPETTEQLLCQIRDLLKDNSNK